MNSRKLIQSLKNKLNIKKNKDLPNIIGGSESYLSKLYSDPEQLSPLQVTNLILKAQEKGSYNAHHFSIKNKWGQADLQCAS